MKKFRLQRGRHMLSRLKKLLLMAKLTTLLILISFMQISAKVSAQAGKLDLKVKNVSIFEVFEEIEDNSEYRFFYDNDQVDLRKKVSINTKQEQISSILKELFKGTDLTYQVKDQLILVQSKYSNVNINNTQQENTVSGTVTDASGGPLPSVTVVIKGTTKGTITDIDGNYSLQNVPGDATLVFSFIGMKMQEISVAGKTSIDIVMEEDAIGIEEVVAIGYGTQNRQEITGAIAVANLGNFREVPVNNILETVKGTIAGLSVGSTNTAGAEASLLIRGQNSIGSKGADNSPLLVVDGVIYNGSLNDISTEDIENLTVLKDASAAAVYGSRSANGVILIETKKGRGINGKPKFNVKLSYGIVNELKRLKVYDADGYIQRLIDINAYAGVEVNRDNMELYLTENERQNYLATPDHKATLTDPYGLIGQSGFNRKADISVANSFEKANYYISISGTDQKGVVLNDRYKNMTGRINISSDLTNWFNLGVKSFYSFRDYSGASPSMTSATGLSPWAKIYAEDGLYERYPNTTTSITSPFWQIATVNVDKRYQLNGVVSAVLKAPWVKGLSYNLNLSGSSIWNEGSSFNDLHTNAGFSANGTGSRSYNKTNYTQADNIIRFKRLFKDKHDVNVTLLYSVEQTKSESMSLSAQNFENMVLLDYKLQNGLTQTVGTSGGESANIGMMARASYAYDRRYSLTGTIRRDGYSGFSLNKKWGNFGSLGFNWNITNESFMDNLNVVDNLALRVSYGSNGNQAIAPYNTLAKVGTDKYVLGGESGYSITQFISSLAANNLSWETTTGTNIGVDFTVLKNRISGSLDGYLTKTTNLIFNRSIPNISGYGSIFDNVGEIKNKGIEIELHTKNIQKSEFSWSSDIAFSLNRNKVVSITGLDADGDGVEDDLVSNGYFIGRSLGTIYSTRIIGMYQQEDVDNGTIMNGMRPGDYILEDLPTEEYPNGDGKINGDDRQFLGISKPNFTWSWTNTFKYKDFTLMAYLYSNWGGNGYFLGSNTPYFDSYAYRIDINHPVYDYWTPDNTGAEFPRLDYNAQAGYTGTKYYDRSFIKLQKVSLSYNMDQWVKPMGINNLLLSVSADNLFIWAPHWIGLDAETAQGLTWGARPSLRTFLFSLSFNF